MDAESIPFLCYFVRTHIIFYINVCAIHKLAIHLHRRKDFSVLAI